MNTKQNIGRFHFRFRRTMAMAIGYFVLLAPILLTLAFRPSPITPCKRNYNMITQSRGIHHARTNALFDKRSKKNVHTHPVHVLRDYYRPQDSLFSGIAEIGMGFSIGVLYSEYFIIMTGCGAPNFGDTLERICYQGVIVFAGLALFNRIVTQFRSSLGDTVNDIFGPLQTSTIWQVRVAEYLSAIAVLGAFVALQIQYSKDVSMDGLSGIDINMCRAIRGDM